MIAIDSPAAGIVIQQPFQISGWAADLGSTAGAGADAVHVWAWPTNGGTPAFVGAATPGWMRNDVGGIFGSRFAPSGFGLTVNGLAGGTYVLVAYMHSTVTNTFNAQRTVTVTIADPVMWVDSPAAGATVSPLGFFVSGWTMDRGASSGSGVDVVHVWAVPVAGGAPTFFGFGPASGARPDVGNVFGSQFAASGFNVFGTLPPGTYDLIVYSHSAVTGTFNAWQVVRVTVGP
jgi:hypothetical protein